MNEPQSTEIPEEDNTEKAKNEFGARMLWYGVPVFSVLYSSVISVPLWLVCVGFNGETTHHPGGGRIGIPRP